MLKIIREILQKYIDDIDSGNSNISQNEQLQLLTLLQQINSTELSATESYKYLGISKSTFYNYIDKGLLPKGVKKSGRGVVWNKCDLEKFLKSK